MVLVIVKVHEPANPDAGTTEEDIITDVFYGFRNQEGAEAWADHILKKWGNPPNTTMLIMDAEHFGTMNPQEKN